MSGKMITAVETMWLVWSLSLLALGGLELVRATRQAAETSRVAESRMLANKFLMGERVCIGETPDSEVLVVPHLWLER